jgi:retron-type reverse transcriptase
MKIEIQGAELDLDLAVLRLKSDLRDDWFPDPLRFADMLTVDAVTEHFRDQYTPQPAVEVNVPKSGFTVRYSLEQCIADRIIYQALADSLDHLDAALAPPIYGFRIRPGRGGETFLPKVQAWMDFNNTVRLRLRDRQGVLLVTDVQNFYEGIWHTELLADIERLGKTSAAHRRLLQRMLNAWSRYDGFALPQNRDASSFLANIYLQHIDSDMLDRGYEYYRYMDDIRVVCDDRFAARRALLDLIGSLRHRHLNVNASKTHIFDGDDERSLDEYVPQPDRDVERFDVASRSRYGADPQSISQLKVKTESLVAAGNFGERSFRACLDRLRRVANSFEGQTLDYSIVTDGLVAAIGDYPWLSDVMAAFLRHARVQSRHIEALTQIVVDPGTFIYSWQGFHVWQLLASLNISSRELRLSAQLQASAGNEAVRAAGALIYLGACGTNEDRIRIAREINQLPDNRLIRRAAILATQELAGFYVDRYFAALRPEELRLRDYVRQQPIPTYMPDMPRRKLSYLNIDLPDEY